MSATVETNTASWRKRSREDDSLPQMDLKRPRYYYYRLESESSKASEEDTESVCSLQDRETDVVRDTTDTDSKSGSEQDEYEVHYEEYDVASLSESDNIYSHSNSSSGSEDMMIAAAAVAICDSSLEAWVTDCEESDNSSLDELSFFKTDFTTCIQCKSENDNPLYRYCEKCFQQSCWQCKNGKAYKCFPLCISCHKDRKKFYPPRPKRNRKSRNSKKKMEPPVKLDTLRSCLSGLSQDSGLGSSQECPPLDLDQIIVPDKHLTPGTSKISTIPETNEKSVEDGREKNISSSFSSTDMNCNRKKGHKRQLSESSLSDFDAKKPKRIEVKQSTDRLVSEEQNSFSQTSDLGSEISSSSFITSVIEKSATDTVGLKNSSSANSELCILCNDAPKDAIFLHSKVAHQCCCYKCAKRTLKSIKRCPICNCTINKVYRVIKS